MQHACSEHVIFKQTQLVTNSLTEWCLLYCRIRYSTYYFLYLSNKVLNHINKKRLELTFYSQDCVVEYVHTKVCEIACSEHCRQHYDCCLCNCDSISSTTITHNIVYIMMAFSVSAPSTWNSLPAHIRSIDTLSTFKRHLKFHLFQSAFTV